MNETADKTFRLFYGSNEDYFQLFQSVVLSLTFDSVGTVVVVESSAMVNKISPLRIVWPNSDS